MARAQGARAQMALAFETTYGTAPASGYTKMPFASTTLGAEQPLIDNELLGFGRDPLNAERLLALPLDARIREVTQAIRENAAASEQAALFSQLFGDRAFTAFQRIDPSVLAQARSELERFGALVNEQDAAQIQRTNDAVSQLGLVWRGLSNQLAVAVAPALARTAEMMARLAEKTGPLGAAIRWLGENVQRVAGYAGAFAAVIAGRLIGKVAAFALGIPGAATAFVLLKRALARLPLVGLVVVLTEAALQFPKLVRGAGSFGEALKLLHDVAIQVWDGIKTSASSLVPALGAIWQDIRAGFFSMLGALTVRWQNFLRTLGRGLENVPGFGGVSDSILSSANNPLNKMSELNAAERGAEGAAIRLRRDAAGRLSSSADEIAAAWQRLSETVKRGSQTATEKLGGGAGNAARRLRGDRCNRWHLRRPRRRRRQLAVGPGLRPAAELRGRNLAQEPSGRSDGCEGDRQGVTIPVAQAIARALGLVQQHLVARIDGGGEAGIGDQGRTLPDANAVEMHMPRQHPGEAMPGEPHCQRVACRPGQRVPAVLRPVRRSRRVMERQQLRQVGVARQRPVQRREGRP